MWLLNHPAVDPSTETFGRESYRTTAQDTSSGMFSGAAAPLRPGTIALLRGIALGAATWLGGCAVIGPTITVTAGPGKSSIDWDRDQRECRAATDATLQPQANAMNRAATSTDQIAANNARIQQMYDAEYGGCLMARGDLVPALAVPQPPVPTPPAPEVAVLEGTRGNDATVSAGLFDAISEGAKRAVAGRVAEFLAACPGESIAVDAHDAPISMGVTARLVGLTQPAGGDCLGSMGEQDYLLVRHGSRWSTLLAGYLGIRDTVHAGYRDVELRSRGSCVFTYAWTGRAYAAAGSNGCDPGTRRASARGRRCIEGGGPLTTVARVLPRCGPAGPAYRAATGLLR